MPSSRRSTAAFPHSRVLVPELSDPLKLVPPEDTFLSCRPTGFCPVSNSAASIRRPILSPSNLELVPRASRGERESGPFLLGSKGSTVLHLADGRKLTRFFWIYTC